MKLSIYICLWAFFEVSTVQAQGGGMGGQQKPSFNKDKKIEVYIEKLKKQSFKDNVDYLGTLKPHQETPVYAQLDSYVEKLNKKIGMYVQKGELVAILKPATLDIGRNSTEILAPASGVVSKLTVEEGMLLTRNQMFFSVMKQDTFKVEINATEEDAAVISKLKTVNLMVDKKKYEAKLESITPALTENLGTQKIILLTGKIENGTVGKVVEINFSHNQRESYAIQKNRVKEDKDGSYIHSINDKSEVERIPVQVGKKEGDIWEIVGEGLNETLNVVGKSTAKNLQTGSVVTVVTEDSKKEEGRKKSKS